MHKIVDYFKNTRTKFTPKTPFTALKAYEEGILPIEAFIYKANSIKQLNEEPYDLEELERILARKDLDLETQIILVEVFEILVNHSDPEIALFAAESINILENRYNKRIEAIKKFITISPEPAYQRQLAELFYELAILNNSRTTIKNFYLKEAFSYYRKLYRKRYTTVKDVKNMVRVLIELNLFDHARLIVTRSGLEDLPEFLMLRAEIEFYAGKLINVLTILRQLSETEGVSDECKKIISYWLGGEDE